MRNISEKNPLIIAVDFDGTVVTHDFPEVGSPVPHAKEVLSRWNEDPRVQMILYTMRSGRYLREAFNYLTKNVGISLFGVNRNPDQSSWTSSPKTYAHVYIDDAALGCPLIYGKHDRPFVDWRDVDEMIDQILN